MVAGQGDEQEPRQLGAEQLLEPVRGRKPIPFTRGAMPDQEVTAAMSCGAHDRGIASP